LGGGGTMSEGLEWLGGFAKERSSRAWGNGRAGMSWFTRVWCAGGAQCLRAFSDSVGALKKDLHVRGRRGRGRGKRLDLSCFKRVWISRTIDLPCFRGFTCLGGTLFKALKWLGGSAEERPSRAWGYGEEGGGRGWICRGVRGPKILGRSISRVLRRFEFLGGHNV